MLLYVLTKATNFKLSVDDLLLRRAMKRSGKRPPNFDGKVRVRSIRKCREGCRLRSQCRTRDRYDFRYLEALVKKKETEIFQLRNELELHRRICAEMDRDKIPENILEEMTSIAYSEPDMTPIQSQ